MGSLARKVGKMMLNVLLLFVTVGSLVDAACDTTSNNPASAQDSANYRPACISALSEQIKMEFEASLQYMLMAAQFSQDTYNLPGVAGFFWASGRGERPWQGVYQLPADAKVRRQRLSRHRPHPAHPEEVLLDLRQRGFDRCPQNGEKGYCQ